MKKSAFLLFFCFMLFNTAIAQSDKLNKFEGTWQWKSNDSLFTVVLKKVKFNGKKFDTAMPDTTVDIIIGWYELLVKDAVIKSSMHGKSNTFNYSKRDFTLWAGENNVRKNGLSIVLNFHKSDFSNQIVWFTLSANGENAEWYRNRMPDVSPEKITMRKIK